MKKALVVIALLCVACLVFAQNVDLAEANIGSTSDSASASLREVSLDLFEREGSWNCSISPDCGVITGRLFDGGPYSDLETSEREEKVALPESVAGASNTKMYGVKVEFFKRGINSFYIKTASPIPIEGVTKTVSVWMAGRNQNHKVTLLIQDYFGNSFELPMGNLAFSGWKKLTVSIPPSTDQKHGIIQQNAYYGSRPGVRIVGFRIDCDPETAIGSYYFYVDDLRAVTDLYEIENIDMDNPDDNW
ncbi:MAG: flagellar filament protein FlaA [Treponema sp.]|nr:flagellar filament protein FlaA [Candidatus Treponema caballi]